VAVSTKPAQVGMSFYTFQMFFFHIKVIRWGGLKKDEKSLRPAARPTAP
jgi:hypothetical protein